MSDHIPTLADVCSAIAEGHLSANSNDGIYQVSALELRRYFNKRCSLPTISFVSVAASLYSETYELSSSSFCNTGL